MEYLGKNIFDKTPLIDNDQTLQSGYALVGKEYKKQERFNFTPANRSFRWTYVCKNVGEARELREFFRSNFGRFGSFWLPSHKRDFIFISYAEDNGNAFLAKKADRGAGSYDQKRHIYIPELFFAAKIIFSQDVGEDMELITLNKPLPAGLDGDNPQWNGVYEKDFYDLFYPFLNGVLLLKKTDIIMNLYLVRLNSDTFTLEKKDAAWMQSALEFTELQRETP